MTYVAAAYGVTIGTLLVYFWMLRRECDRLAAEERRREG
jgi:hypothetical protein